VNTPTLAWVYTRALQERGRRETQITPTSVVSLIKRDAVYLNEKKMGYEKIFAESQKQQVRKFENETVGKGKP
jgi:hypothetical protein